MNIIQGKLDDSKYISTNIYIYLFNRKDIQVIISNYLKILMIINILFIIISYYNNYCFTIIYYLLQIKY